MMAKQLRRASTDLQNIAAYRLLVSKKYLGGASRSEKVALSQVNISVGIILSRSDAQPGESSGLHDSPANRASF
jgi:hypothetical protein